MSVDPPLPVEEPTEEPVGGLEETVPASPSDRRDTDRRGTSARIVSGSIVVIVILYVAKPVVIPVALAILLAFLLRPIVSVLEKTFLRRAGAIALSVGLAVAAITYGAWSLVLQARSLASEVASYSGNIERKLRTFNARSGSSFAAVEKTLERIASSGDKSERPDMAVRVIPEKKTLFERYEKYGPTVEFTASAFLVIVLVFFLLQDREKLRDKLLRLAGRAHLTVTTQAIGETGHRISQYIFTVALLNLGFGVLIGIGLALLNVPHALLWAILAALLRFVPYIGAVISAAGPTFMAFAAFPDWWVPIAVLGLFLVVDQFLGGFIEPLVVGHRVGVSPIALLVAAIFWGWLWGPVGLLLATPITVCLNVAGEFIPALRVFSILFGTETTLEDYLTFYNRLLLRDRVGAIAIVDRYAEDHSMERAFEDLLVPTLNFSTEELTRKRITNANDHFIKDVIRESIIRLGDHNSAVGEPWQRIVAVSVAGQRLSLGTLMLTQLLRAEGFVADYFTDLSPEEIVEYLNEVAPQASFISCSNPERLNEGLALLELLSRKFPELFIIAGGSGFANQKEAATAAGATYVPEQLSTAREHLLKSLSRPRRRVAR